MEYKNNDEMIILLFSFCRILPFRSSVGRAHNLVALMNKSKLSKKVLDKKMVNNNPIFLTSLMGKLQYSLKKSTKNP